MTEKVLAGFALTLMTMANVGMANLKNQSPECRLSESDAPQIRGVRLGMSAEQVVALFPASTKRKEIKDSLEKAKAPGGDLVFLTLQSGDDEKRRLEDVAGLSIGLYKNRVVEVSIQYIGPHWKDVDEWITKLSETFKLPSANAWREGPDENPNKVLTCNGIEINAAIQGGGGSLRIRNTEALRAAPDRTKAADETRKREYKP